MKNFILAVFIILITSCNNDKTKTINKTSEYNIKGTITGFADSTKVYLKDINLEQDIDSTFILKDTFRFTGKFENNSVPEQLWLYINLNKGKDFFYTYLLIRNNDRVVITGDKKDFPFCLNIKGSKTQEIANILNAQTRDLNIEYDKLMKQYFSLNENDKKTGEKIAKNLKELRKQITEIKKKYIKKYINSYNGIIELNYNKKLFSKDTIRELFSQVDSTIQNSKYGKKIEFYINNEILKKGDKYSDFSAINQKGDTVKFSKYLTDNKYLLLDFNSTYCGPCMQSIDELKEIYNKYSNKITIVSFNVDNNKKIWEKELQRDQTKWMNLWDGKGNASSTYIKYGISAVPTFFILNPKGEIIEKQIGYGKGILTELLKKNEIIE